EEINCSNNSIREIDVSTCSQLKKLNISKNLLESLDLVKAISLTTLDCSQNKIGSIQFSENTKLKTVNCSTNQLKEFDYDKLPVVEDLNISANQLSRLDISNHDKLRKLTANDNELTTIQTSPNDTLANLQLENNNISDIGPLNNLKNINTLGLSQNQITDIRPLYGLEELGNFYIRDQDIKVPVPKVVNRRTTLDIFKTTSQKGLELPDFPTIYNSYTINGDLIELHDITPVILNEGSFEFSYNPYSIKEGALWYGAKYYTGTVTFLETSELSSVLEPEKHKFNDGEKINWTLKIKNELKKKATNIKVKMDSNSEFIIDPESTKVAGTDSSVSIADGIDLEDLATNEEVTITFSATMSGKADELVEPTGEVTWEAETVNSPYSNIINGKGIKGAEPEQIDHPDKENDLVILSTPRMFHFGLFNWSTDDFDNRNLDAQKYHHLSNVTNTGFYVRIKQNKTTNWSLSAGLSEFTDEKGSPMPGTVGTRLSIAKPTVERVLNHETHEEKIVTNPENPPTLNQDLSFYAGSSAKTILSGATNSGTDQNVWQVRIPFKSVTLSLPTNSGLLKKDFSASFTWSLNDTP
ncbi:leucine-rich repeat domain-containing protein, partial [Enterococcus sp. 3H8_DIV0648]|uniref:leucine-rich repeat domain-containing protein n=3 Tax=Enterococcus TaxID=1350 RepID=UPI000B5A563E